MPQNAGVLYILPCKCASRHSGVPFFNIGTSKSGPSMWCFAHFDLKMSFSTSELQKVIRPWGVLYILTYACVFRRSGVPFFDIGTTKSAPTMRCFVYFDLQMCFSPQRRAIFRQVLRHRQFFSIFTSKCAFRHSGVPFFTCLLNSYLRTRRFSEPTFRTSGTTNHWENTAIRVVPNIFRACTFFLLTLHACWSPFCWLDISTLLDTSTLLFNSAYCRKLDF